MPKSKIEVVIDCADPTGLARFWGEALGYRQLWASDELVILVSRSSPDPPVLLQRVPEPKVSKNRVHFDLVFNDVEAEVARMESLGAKRAHVGVQTYGRTQWVVMTDPEDNEFCVSTGIPL